MQITGVDVVGRRIAFTRPFPVSYESHTKTEHAFVRIRTDGDLVGYGEGTALPWFTGETTAGMVEVIREFAEPRIVGESVADASAAFDRFASSFPGSPGASAAVGSALLDLRAKRFDAPARELLGPTVDAAIDEVYPVPGLDPGEAATVAAEARDEGYRRFKVKATGEVETDVARVNAVLEALPASASVRIDPNTSWTDAHTTIAAAGRIDDLDRVEYFEQPVDPDRPAAMGTIQDETGVPVFADESVHGFEDVERLSRNGWIAGCCLKLAKFGSPTAMWRAGRLAADRGLSVTVVSAFGTSLDAATNLGVAATLSNLSSGCEIAPMFLESDPAVAPLDAAPVMEPTDGPGWGVELDDDCFD